MNTSSLKEQQQRKIKWSNDKEMFALVHQMRARVITSPSFNGDRIVGTILFEGTMDGDIGGQPTADYLESEAQRALPESG
jgi:fructose-bisphosphate aldolase, class I